jgi:hypothetical protein
MAKFITSQDNPEEHEKAMGLVQNYQVSKKDNSIDAHFVSKAALQQFLDNPDFEAFKVHHARAEDGTRTVVLEGLNAKGESLNAIVSELPTCPPMCDWAV